MKKPKSIRKTRRGVCLSIVLIGTVMGLVMGLQSVSTAATAKPLVLSLSFWGTLNEPLGMILQEYAAEINRGTQGMVKINIYPGGSLTPGPQAYEGIVNGVSQMAMVMYPYNPGRFPLIMAWTLPLSTSSTKSLTQMFNESVE